MELELLKEKFSICKLKENAKIGLYGIYTFLAHTDDEISLICESSHVPEDIAEVRHGLCAFRIAGKLDFSLIGVVSGITSVLAENGISVLVVSTYNTDYIFINEREVDRSMELLKTKQS